MSSDDLGDVVAELLRDEDAEALASPRRSITARVPRAIEPTAGSAREVELGQAAQQRPRPSNSKAASAAVRS